MIPTLEWLPTGVNFLDQTKLPLEETYVLATDYKQVATVIRDMIVRGAMAIGVSAAMGVALGIKNSTATTLPELTAEVNVICDTLAKTRPTAVNLFWGIAQIRDRYNQLAAANTSIPEIKAQVVALAQQLYDEDIANLRKLGAFGAELLPQEGTVLTHCNAGALAACGFGSALGVIRAAIARGQKIDVFADETRPFNQGTRLTAWELTKDNIPTTLICDNMAGYFMSKGRISAVIVGADRIAPTGDTANKVGTYRSPVLTPKEHGNFLLRRRALQHHRPCDTQWRSHPYRAARHPRVHPRQRRPGHPRRRPASENPAFDAQYPGLIQHRHHHRARSPARTFHSESIRQMDTQPTSDPFSSPHVRGRTHTNAGRHPTPGQNRFDHSDALPGGSHRCEACCTLCSSPQPSPRLDTQASLLDAAASAPRSHHAKSQRPHRCRGRRRHRQQGQSRPQPQGLRLYPCSGPAAPQTIKHLFEEHPQRSQQRSAQWRRCRRVSFTNYSPVPPGTRSMCFCSTRSTRR